MLVLAPRALAGGGQFFWLTATDAAGRRGAVATELSVAAPPRGVTFSVDPPSGAALMTEFTLRARGWVVAADRLPSRTA